MDRFGLETDDGISRALAPVYEEMESARSMTIPARVRSFIEDVVSESYHTRGREWAERSGVFPEPTASTDPTIEIVRDAVVRILQEVDPDETPEGREVLLIGTLEVVSRNWCGIFPFCR